MSRNRSPQCYRVGRPICFVACIGGFSHPPIYPQELLPLNVIQECGSVENAPYDTPLGDVKTKVCVVEDERGRKNMCGPSLLYPEPI